MMGRNLKITLEPDWKAALRATAQLAKAETYQGEVLNFETPAQFFGLSAPPKAAASCRFASLQDWWVEM